MYITEYEEMGDAGYRVNPPREPISTQMPQEPPLAVQTITSSIASAPSAAFNANTKFVSIQLSVNGHIQFADAPVATSTTSHLHVANAVSFHSVVAGSKVAVIDA